MKNITIILLLSFLSGCATTNSPIPEGYKGAIAIIKDSTKVYNYKKADFFYLSKVDGKKIEDSLIKTRQVNYGRGMSMTPEILQRPVPVKPAIFTIVGRTEYAAPILALTNNVYEVKGDISFTPEENKNYGVHGELTENYSAVWIEDESTHQVIGNKIEINGSARLGIFQK